MQRMCVFLKRNSYVGNNNNDSGFCVGSDFGFCERLKNRDDPPHSNTTI